MKQSSQFNSNEGKFSQTGDSTNRFNNLNTITKKDTLGSSKNNDLYDLKNEIKLLQNKINGLGKTLCIYYLTKVNRKNSMSNSLISTKRAEESFLGQIKNQNKKDSVPLKNSKSKSNSSMSISILKKSNQNSRLNSPVSKNKKKIDKTRSLSKSAADDNPYQGADYKTYCYREAITVWKEKYYKLMRDDKTLHENLEIEKRKNEELAKYLKNLENKWSSYDKINYKFNKLIDEHEKLLIRYDESESIRKEQSQLIKVLKKELQFLGKWSKPEEAEKDFPEEQ